MSDIVKEIVDAVKSRIPIVCNGFSKELDYAYNLQMNSADRLERRFGVLPLPADPVRGSLGAKRYDHTIQIILTEEVGNSDCDADMQEKILSLYPCMFELCKDFQAFCLVASDSTKQLIQVKAGAFDIPEVLGENDGVALRMNMIFQYQLRK